MFFYNAQIIKKIRWKLKKKYLKFLNRFVVVIIVKNM